ncbi:MAG: hypothetical protein LJE67_11935 [Salaquimonas sp.]|jgi:methyltransferase|nr:hypothetical protein [Salaquimonas sp.]
MPEADPAAIGFIAFLIAQRLSELVISRRNNARAFARGGVEAGAGHYPFIIVLHTVWLVAIAATGWDKPVHWPMLGLFAVLQIMRISAMLSLGERWTTRIIVEDRPLVRTGLYRWFRHPNYMVVVAEMVVAPMVLGLLWITIVFSILNAVMLAIRIRAEDKALDSRSDREGST